MPISFGRIKVISITTAIKPSMGSLQAAPQLNGPALSETRTDQGCDDVKLGREPIDDECQRGFDLARRIKTLPETVS